MKLDFDNVNLVLEAYDAWRARKKSLAKQAVIISPISKKDAEPTDVPTRSTKLKPEDGVEVLCATVVFLVALLQGCVLTVFEKHMRKRFPEIDNNEKFQRYLNPVGANGNGANSSEPNINRLFARIGIVDALEGFACTDTPDDDLRKLNDLYAIRNQIAHGLVRAEYQFGEEIYRIKRLSVNEWTKFRKSFAKVFESHVGGKFA